MKLIAKTLIGLGLMTCCVLDAHAQPAVEQPTQVTFSRSIVSGQPVDRVQSYYSWGWQTLPSHTIAIPGGGFAHSIAATVKPAGTHTQWLAFRFRSNNLFTANPGAHFAVAGKAEGTSWYVRGRGFIVGGLSGNNPPCVGGIRSQPESWYSVPSTLSSAHYLWGGSYCGSTLADNVWYDVTMHVKDDGWFAYTISQNGATVGGGFAIQDTAATNPEVSIINSKLTGYMFGLVFADNYSAPWTLEFANIGTGWF